MTAVKASQNRFSPLISPLKTTTTVKHSVIRSATANTTQNKPKDVNFQGPSCTDTGKMKSVNEINGIPVLDLSEGGPEKLNEVWMVKQHGRSVPVMKTIAEEEDLSSLLQFTHEDVKQEVEFWNNSVFCYILGANPPTEVIEGFVYRIWSQFGIDRVSFLDNGIFIVRFTKYENREALLHSGYYMFDNKPVVIHPWVAETELIKEKVDIVPVWAKLSGIPLKLWGACLPKIAGLVGKFIRMDDATADKIRLSFARVMVEVPFNQKLPDKVRFLDESGQKPQNDSGSVDPPPAFTPTVKATPAKQIMWVSRQENMVGVRLSGRFSKYTFMDVLNNYATPRARVEKQWKVPPPANLIMHSIGFWNVRGLNDLNKQKIFKWFMHNNGVGLFDLLETKLKPSKLLNKMTTICDGWSVSTNCSWHKGGRIWILWNPTCFDVQFLNYNAQHIHMLVHSKVDDKSFYLTMIYAFNDLNERTVLWRMLKDLASTCNIPWLWVGDFNTVLSPIERLGGNTTEAEMEHFQECVSLCEMEDIQATGALFTWSNKQAPNERVYSRLDRAMGNPEWMTQFGDYVAHFHPEGMFDHCPYTIVNRKAEFGGKTSFKYFNMWGISENFKPSVEGIWRQSYKGTKMFRVVKKLKALKPILKNLNKTCFFDIENSTIIAGTVL
ncbi:uncharacterized protein LOC141618033 [Silene latifolia]|uniref:uncharacterized protein LOC141618033 n=1 Tax=Silene latifolia TaxID=37657 RepID=UPI003D76ABA7